MIDIATQIANVEKLMKLMKKYQIEELSVDFINLKRPLPEHKERVKRPYKKKHVPTLDKHLQPLPNEPWNDIPDSVIDQWSVDRKI